MNARSEAVKRYLHTPKGQAWYARRRAERYGTINAIKLSRGCADCGYNESAVALDFDHVRGVKTFTVSAMIERHVKLETILEEIEKCDVVCANHHRIRTAARRIK